MLAISLCSYKSAPVWCAMLEPQSLPFTFIDGLVKKMASIVFGAQRFNPNHSIFSVKKSGKKSRGSSADNMTNDACSSWHAGPIASSLIDEHVNVTPDGCMRWTRPDWRGERC